MRRLSGLLVSLAFACGGGSSSPPVAVSLDVVVANTGAPAQMAAVGAQLQLAANAKDSAGVLIPGGTFSWTSANQAVATVDRNGLVTAVSNGSAVITAGIGAVQGSITVTVAQVPSALTIVPATQTVGPGVTFSFTAQVLDSGGHTISGGSAPVWSIDDSTLATISSTGSGLALEGSGGTTHVHATAGALSGSAALIVDPAAAPVASVSLSPLSFSFASLGEQKQLQAQALNKAGNPIPISISFSSSQPAVASVGASGLVTAVGNGTATVTATAGGKSSSSAITVAQQVAKVLLAPPALTVLNSLGQTLQLSAKAEDALNVTVAFAPLVWSSSANAVATVDNAGLVTAKANGTATITVSSGAVHDQISLTVQQTVQQVSVAPSAQSIAPNSTLDFAASGLDGNGHPVPGAPPAVWQSNDQRVIIDSDGHADIGSGFGFGNAIPVTITATIAGIGGTAALSVDPALTPVAKVVFLVGGGTLSSIGDTLQLSAQAEDAAGNPVPRHVIAWSVSDGTGNVVTVDQTGLVTAAGNGQKSIVAGTNGVTASTTVAVAQVVASVRVSTGILGASTTLTSLQDTLALQATGFDARNHPLPGGIFSWSSDSANAAVDQSGLVTAISNGPANIFASLGGITSTPGFPVTVQQAVSTIEVSASTATTLSSLGDTVQLTANAFDARHNSMAATFVWSPTAGAAATVDQTGLVTAVVNGTANVQASSGGKTGSLAVTVAQVPVSVSVSGTATLVSFNATAQLSASGVDARGHAIPGLGGATWRSDSSNVSVNGTGLITANANGSANLFAKVGSIESPAFVVTVAQAVATVTVTGNAQLSSIDQTSQLTATAFDANGFALAPPPNGGFGWAVATGGGGGGGGNVVSVNSSGLVTASGNGSATVNASAKGKTGSLVVTVLQIPVGSIPLTPASATIAAGTTQTFAVNGTDANGHPIRSANLVWQSSNPSVAAIGANGVASGLTAGTVTISATLNGVAATNTSQLTVTGP